VPVTLRAGSGPIERRVEVRAKSKASIRIATASAPLEVTINDGSVPESDTTNNSYTIPAADIK